MKNKSSKITKMIREIKTYAKQIIDDKNDQDMREAF